MPDKDPYLQPTRSLAESGLQAKQQAGCWSLKKPTGSYIVALPTLNRKTVLSCAAVASMLQSADMASTFTAPAAAEEKEKDEEVQEKEEEDDQEDEGEDGDEEE